MTSGSPAARTALATGAGGFLAGFLLTFCLPLFLPSCFPNSNMGFGRFFGSGGVIPGIGRPEGCGGCIVIEFGSKGGTTAMGFLGEGYLAAPEDDTDWPLPLLPPVLLPLPFLAERFP